MTIGAQCEVVDDYRGADRLASHDFLTQESYRIIAGPLRGYSVFN